MQEFFAMGGYATFVWGSFGAAAAVAAWNVWAPKAQRRSLLRQLVDDDGGAGEGSD